MLRLKGINMDIAEYNIRTLVFHLVILWGAVWILLDGIHAVKNKPLKIILIVITIIALLSLIFSLFASFSYRDDISASGRIVEVSHTGSLAGILDSFAIRVEQYDGTLIWYHTSIFSSSSFKELVQQLEVGDCVQLYSNNFLDLFYRYEKINN